MRPGALSDGRPETHQHIRPEIVLAGPTSRPLTQKQRRQYTQFADSPRMHIASSHKQTLQPRSLELERERRTPSVRRLAATRHLSASGPRWSANRLSSNRSAKRATGVRATLGTQPNGPRHRLSPFGPKIEDRPKVKEDPVRTEKRRHHLTASNIGPRRQPTKQRQNAAAGQTEPFSTTGCRGPTAAARRGGGVGSRTSQSPDSVPEPNNTPVEPCPRKKVTHPNRPALARARTTG